MHFEDYDLNDQWFDDFGFEQYKPEFTPSPLYNPESPNFSGIYLDNSESKKQDKSKFPRNIHDLEDFPDLPAEKDIDDEINDVLSKRKFRSKRKNKERAEFEFDKTAQPISISNFQQFVTEEPISARIIEDKIDIGLEFELKDELEAEELVIRSVCVAQNNAPIEESELVKSVQFPDHINSEYVKHLEKDPTDFDFSTDLIRNEKLVNNNSKLFFERRLLQSIQFRNISDPEFIKNHFPMEEDFFKIDVRFMFNEDNNSLDIIRNKLQSYMESRSSLKDLFYGRNWRNNFAEVMKWRNQKTHQAVSICSLALFFQKNLFKKRDIELNKLDSIFKNSVFKYSSLNEVFRYLGIVFMTDMCPFSLYRDSILNLLEYSHQDVISKIHKVRKLATKKKRKIDKIVNPWFIEVDKSN